MKIDWLAFIQDLVIEKNPIEYNANVISIKNRLCGQDNGARKLQRDRLLYIPTTYREINILRI